MPKEKIRQLIEDIEAKRITRLETLIDELRDEFGSLKNICVALLNDLEVVDDRLNKACEVLDKCPVGDIDELRKLINELNTRLTAKDIKLAKLETVIRTMYQHRSDTPIIINNSTNTVGGDVQRDLNVKGDTNV